MFDAQDLPGSVSAQTDSPSLPVPGGAQPVHLLDRLAAIFKHRRIAGAAFVIVVGVMMVQTYSQVPMYRTSSRVMIRLWDYEKPPPAVRAEVPSVPPATADLLAEFIEALTPDGD